MDVFFQPKGPGSNDNRHGTVNVQAPLAGAWGTANYKIDTYSVAGSGGIGSGALNDSISGRFDDINYYTT